MSAPTQTEHEKQSFAETALRLSGKSEEEARRTGAMDRADEQVEQLFAPQYKTVNSPVHRAVWDKEIPLDQFMPPDMPVSAPCDASMDKCVQVLRRRREQNTILDDRGKVSHETLDELAQAGYWGMLIDPKFGGQGAPFARFGRFLTRMASLDPMTAGLASVHGCIGAVDPVRSFGNAEQKAKFLPRLANGRSLSGFALTEPNAGSDLTALRTTATLKGDHYEINGEKLFITNAIPGRTIGLVVMLEGKPAVVIADLPEQEDEHFQVVPYGVYALRNGYNNGLKFSGFQVPRENLLTPPLGDGLTIAYHGLNLGRIALCANASGTMRILLANMLPWADFRRTYGQAINTRELVKRRIARMAAMIVGCDALVDWCSGLIDQGYRGELECVIAKIFGSESLKEAAIELFMKTHGGRSFLQGHSFGDNVYDFLAPCIYEGEGEVLSLAFFKSLVKHHGLKFFEPIGKALQRAQIRTFNPLNPTHAWALRHELGAYGKWFLGQQLSRKTHTQLPSIAPNLVEHVDFAMNLLAGFPVEISTTMRKHQLKLADRQCRMAELSGRVQDSITLLVTALWASKQKEEATVAAADLLCQDIRRKITGKRPTDRYFRDAGRLADMVISGGFERIAGAPQAPIMRPYQN